MGRTTVEVGDDIRDELRSYKADYGLTYDEAITQLLREVGWDFRHASSDGECQ